MSTRAPRSPGLPLVGDDRPAEAFEQLDAALRVVTVRSWGILGVVFATLAGFVAFACWYEVPLKVNGRGIILARETDGDSLLQITAPATGRIQSVSVRLGDTIAPGYLLGRIDRSDLNDRILQATSELRLREEENAKLTRFDEEQEAIKKVALDKLEETLKKNVQRDNDRLEDHEKIKARDRRLRSQNMLNDLDELKSRVEADAVKAAIGTNEAKVYEVQADRNEDRTNRQRDRLKRELAIKEAKENLRLLTEQYERETRILCPEGYSGKVVDLMLTPHALIEKGAPAVLIRPTRAAKEEPRLEAIIFVPAGLGKRIRLPQDAEVSPDTVRRHEHGFIRGEVTSVSEIPATESAMLAELKHKALVASFEREYEGQALLSVHVKLHEEAPTPLPGRPVHNRLKWSSRSGTEQWVTTGTLCTAWVVVERKPLISLAIPWVRHVTNLE